MEMGIPISRRAHFFMAGESTGADLRVPSSPPLCD